MSDRRPPAAQPYMDDAWQRWEMSTFDPPYKPEGMPDRRKTALPARVLAQIEQMSQDARQKAVTQGYAEGLMQGRESGHAEGYALGKSEGLAAGQKEGYDAGFSSGHAEGQALGQEQTRQLQALLSACGESLSSIESDMGQALISLAISIASQVVRTTLSVEPEKILDTVRDIIHIEAGKDAILRLRVNPADLELIQTYLTDDPNANRWRLQPDAAIERGGCIAETALGCIDATLQTRWQRVTSTLGQNHAWLSDK